MTRGEDMEGRGGRAGLRSGSLRESKKSVH